MNLLLDTHVFIWLDTKLRMLPSRVRDFIQDTDNKLFLSGISVWEICQKHAVGKLPLVRPPLDFVRDGRRLYGIEALPFEEEAALCLDKLPRLHSDPFDRMLLCQAIHHALAVVTNDRRMQHYPVKTIW